MLTGASGFIGRQVARSLECRGHNVVRVEKSQVDLLNPNDVDNFIASAKPEGLVHLAWETTPVTYWESQQNLLWQGASLYLLESFAQHGGKRAIVAGTSAEYQWGNEGDLKESSSPLIPNSLYGVSKDTLRRKMEVWAPGVGVSWAWGRVFCPFGPHEKESRLIPKLISKLQSGERVSFDSGSLVRDFIHVEDLGEAFSALYDSEVEGAVNLASGVGISIRQILTQLADEIGGAGQIDFGSLPDPIDQVPRVVASVKRLQDEVNWTPNVDFCQRLHETCQWWIRN